MKLLFVFASLCLAFVRSVSAELVTASEMPVSPAIVASAAFDQTQGRIASDGHTFFAVWVDRSSGTGDILATPLTADGARTSDEPIAIAASAEDEGNPAIAWNGDRYLVVWQSGTTLRSRLIARDQTVSEAITIVTDAAIQPQLAFNGRFFLAMWRTSTGFRGALLDRLGAVVKTFDIAMAQTWPEHAVVAVQGTFYLVSALTDPNGAPGPLGYPSDAGVTPIDEQGNVGTRVVLAPATTPVIDLHASATANDLLVGWTTTRGLPGAQIRTARFTPGTGVTAVESFAAESEFLYDVVAEGNEYLLFFGNDGVKRVRAGSHASTDLVTSHPPSSFTDVATNGTTAVAIERTFGGVDPDLHAVNVRARTSTPLAVAPRHQSLPDIAHAGESRMAVWMENRAIFANGVQLDTASAQTQPRVASNGTDFFVVWRDGSDIAGMRVARSGARIDTAAIGIASNVFDDSGVAVSWDGISYVVVYSRGFVNRRPVTTMYAARVSAQGVASHEVALSAEGGHEFPDIASGADGSLIVWRNGPFLTGALLSRANTVTPVAFPSTMPGSRFPAVAWSGNTYLVAAQVSTANGWQLQWMLVSASGVVTIPATRFLELEAGLTSVDATAFGDAFPIAYTRGQTLLAARISRAGELVDGPVIVAQSVTGFAASNASLLYTRHIGAASRGVTRAFVRELQVRGGALRRRAVR
jgi:hypothetical protein